MTPGSGSLQANLVDLHQRRIYPAQVDWAEGRITAITELPGLRSKQYLCPGFVDAHIHIESSLLPPSEFARHAVVHGTVATVSDPHEIANVLGLRGVEYMLSDARRTPFKFNFGAPSCVPATTFETAGAALDAEDVAGLLAYPEIKYLAEVMNFPGVLNRAPSLMAMIAAARREGKPVDGHAPGLRGADAARYASAGITTDHECFTLAEALDKIAAGMKILIREGSAARNFQALAPLLKSHPQHCMFCSDDLHPDLLAERHIDGLVRRAFRSGADRLEVLRCACLYPVEHYKLGVGLLRVGDPADFILFENWHTLRVLRTWLDGTLVARDGRSLLPRLRPRLLNRFRARRRKVSDFQGQTLTSGSKVNVIEALNGQLITRHLRTEVGKRDPRLKEVCTIAVVNRYRASAPIAIGLIQGFGLKAGAIASSVAHDSHNIVAVGKDRESLCKAVNLVIKNKGGLSVVGPKESACLPLPIAGLMSKLSAAAVARRYTRLDRMAKDLGSTLDAPFMTLSFMALLVIPELKLSDKGLFSASAWQHLALAD